MLQQAEGRWGRCECRGQAVGAGEGAGGSAKKETSHATVRFFVARFIYYDYLFCFVLVATDAAAAAAVATSWLRELCRLNTHVCATVCECVWVRVCVFGLSRLISFVQVCLSLRHFFCFCFFCSFCLLLARCFCCCFVLGFFLFKSSTNRARVCHAYCAHFWFVCVCRGSGKRSWKTEHFPSSHTCAHTCVCGAVCRIFFKFCYFFFIFNLFLFISFFWFLNALQKILLLPAATPTTPTQHTHTDTLASGCCTLLPLTLLLLPANYCLPAPCCKLHIWRILSATSTGCNGCVWAPTESTLLATRRPKGGDGDGRWRWRHDAW